MPLDRVWFIPRYGAPYNGLIAEEPVCYLCPYITRGQNYIVTFSLNITRRSAGLYGLVSIEDPLFLLSKAPIDHVDVPHRTFAGPPKLTAMKGFVHKHTSYTSEMLARVVVSRSLS